MTTPGERWIFGNAALDETKRFAAVARRVVSAVLQMETPSRVVAELTESLSRTEATLRQALPADPHPRVGPHVDSNGRVYLDHSRNVGDYNPFFPVYTLEIAGNTAQGNVHFPVAFEGPPGIVHGGFLALLFDLAIQQHNCDLGLAGKTTRLEVGYKAPTPLLTDLRIEIDRSRTDRRIESDARLFDGETLCATATMRAVAGDRDRLPAVSPRREA